MTLMYFHRDQSTSKNKSDEIYILHVGERGTSPCKAVLNKLSWRSKMQRTANAYSLASPLNGIHRKWAYHDIHAWKLVQEGVVSYSRNDPGLWLVYSDSTRRAAHAHIGETYDFRHLMSHRGRGYYISENVFHLAVAGGLSFRLSP